MRLRRADLDELSTKNVLSYPFPSFSAFQLLLSSHGFGPCAHFLGIEQTPRAGLLSGEPLPTNLFIIMLP
jgi:hypothetical protein